MLHLFSQCSLYHKIKFCFKNYKERSVTCKDSVTTYFYYSLFFVSIIRYTKILVLHFKPMKYYYFFQIYIFGTIS